MRLLLKLKPWQLFTLIIIPAFIPNSLSIYTIMECLSLSISLGWIYVVGITMQSLIPASVKPNSKYFKFYFLLIIIALILFVIAKVGGDNLGNWVSILAVIIYTIGFIAACSFAGKMLESVIEGEIVGNSDALKAIICFIIFPIGLWYIQPAVHRVLVKYSEQTT